MVRENLERSHQTGKHGPRSVEKSDDEVVLLKKKKMRQDWKLPSNMHTVNVVQGVDSLQQAVQQA